MQLEFKIEERPTQPIVSVRTQIPMSGLPSFFERAFGLVYSHIQESGQHPAGPPVAIYHTQDMSNCDLEAGFPVVRAIDSSGEVKSSEIPGGNVCTTLLLGPYDQLPAAWEAITAYAAAEGLETETWCYEIYVNDPSTVPSDEIQTQLVLPLK